MLKKINLKGIEEWREYDFSGRIYRIDNPVELVIHENCTTHRIVDINGITHCVPAPGISGCVLRWKGITETVSF